ncbi:MAG: YfhO family protein, partial [Aliifodinibius sp.]|nr:YfhO family protein [Fodinibius sp.]NIV14554.1 YfhO family protein [Fodinibius sp.]NIY28400.1 YfhO family protein [Fodinibius sp.]
YMPGWKARLDGQETQVYIANHAFRAVVVPAGTHQIKFIYQPLTFWIGSGISLLSLFFLLAWLLSIIKGSSK